MFKFFRRRDANVLLLENRLTPVETARLIDEGRYSASQFEVSRLLRNAAPKPFARHTISERAALYSAPGQADTLLIGFADIASHLMTPIAVVLQSLPETTHVLLVTDPSLNHFTHGIDGLGDTFGDLIAGLRRFARQGGYPKVVTLGTSMGGYPALRAGRLLGCGRAVSVGGNMVWHMKRFRDGQRPTEAFDPLCECVHSTTPCIALHSVDSKRDASHAARMAALSPYVQIVAIPGKEHLIIHEAFKRDRLDALLDHLFDTGRPIDAGAIAALMR